jgi:hypothetical protein
MSVPEPAAWQELFVPGDLSNPGAVIHVSLIQRAGRPFLVLPADAATAARALVLYAAQTPRARLAKSLLTLALRLKLPLGLPALAVPVEHDEPFAAFLTRNAGGHAFPRFAILLGNPLADGPRFIFLLFNERNEPVAVVKAGMGASAVALIEHEAKFLAAVPPHTRGVPRLRATLRTERVHALALDFIPGDSADPDAEAEVEKLLTSWVDTTRTVKISELPAWQRLTAACGASSPGEKTWSELANVECHPALYHGDFAPWNLKAAPDGWRALDWERGEPAGVPGWDWFHFVIQHAVLVRRESPAALAARVERLLASPGFVRYAARAKIAGHERPLVLAYLNYSLQILKQTEQLPRVQALLEHLAVAANR